MSALPIPTQEHTVPGGVLEDPADREYPAILPPFGSIGEDDNSHGQALSYFHKIGQTADQAREDFVEQAESNGKVYQWGREWKACGPGVGSPAADAARRFFRF